jgi:hypothetical protein
MKTFVFGALAFCFLAGMIGAAQTAEPFLLKPLDHGAWAAIDNPAAKSQQSGSNAGFVIGNFGLSRMEMRLTRPNNLMATSALWRRPSIRCLRAHLAKRYISELLCDQG